MTEQSPTVFVVDDDASIRDALKSLIRSVGLRVELFGSPSEFLQWKRPDAPSCLVLDVRLPGKSGLDLQRELAEANIHVPIIFITGHGDISTSLRAKKGGAVEFLTKPFRDQDLLDAIELALKRDGTRRVSAVECVTMNCDFKVGDVVRLKAGSPDMAIESIGPQSHGFTSGAWCIWQVGDQKKRGFFEFMTLCHADLPT